MTAKISLILATLTVLLSSCYKQSIPDAMLNNPGKQTTTATMSYEINGNKVTIIGKEVNYPGARYQTLECVKSGGYVLSGVLDVGADFVFTFYTDSLKLGNYKFTNSWGNFYVTTFEGRPQYVYGPADHMSFNVTSYKEGRISGNFTGQLTPAISQGPVSPIYGVPGSVVIKNGSFTNVPVIY